MSSFVMLHARSAAAGNAAIEVPVAVGHVAAVVPPAPTQPPGSIVLLAGGGAIQVIEEIEAVVLALQQAGAAVHGEVIRQ